MRTRITLEVNPDVSLEMYFLQFTVFQKRAYAYKGIMKDIQKNHYRENLEIEVKVV